MHVSFTREYSLDASRDKIWSFLNSPKNIVQCIPDAEELEILDDGFKFNIRPRFVFIKGRFRIESRVIERKDIESIKISIRGSSVGSSFDAMINIILTDRNVRLMMDIDTYGLLKPLSRSLMYQVVSEISSSIFSCINERLSL